MIIRESTVTNTQGDYRFSEAVRKFKCARKGATHPQASRVEPVTMISNKV